MRRFTVAASLAALLFSSLGTTAQASTTGPSYVTSILSTASGYVYFMVQGSRSAPPSCGATFSTRFAFNVTTPGGQALLSTLLTAAAAHKSVVVAGTGACDAGPGDTEGVSYIDMTP